MTSNRLAELEHRLANAAPGDLAVVAYDGLVLALQQTDLAPRLDPNLAVSFDKALALIGQTLPNWSFTLQGTVAAVGGTWTCTLRESGLRDDLEVIGFGTAAAPPLAMIVALLRVLLIRAKGYT